MKNTHIDFEISVDVVVHDQTVGEPDSVRLHGMARHVGIISNV